MGVDPFERREGFPSTHWSLVAAAGGGSETALNELIRRYLPALALYLTRHRGLDRASAEDLLQDFLMERVVKAEIIARYQRERGKFRTFLLAALSYFVSKHFRDARAKKRAAVQAGPLSEANEPAASPAIDPGRAFDLIWARQVIALAVERMRVQCADEQRADVWTVFDARVLRPIFHNESPMPFEKLGLTGADGKPVNGSNLLVTAKRKFGRVLRGVIGEYELGPLEVERELVDLWEFLAASGGR